MLALLFALYILGGRASYEELRIMLEHADCKGVRALAARTEDAGLIRRPGEKGAPLELTPAGVACVLGKLRDPLVSERMRANREMRAQRAA